MFEPHIVSGTTPCKTNHGKGARRGEGFTDRRISDLSSQLQPARLIDAILYLRQFTHSATVRKGLTT